MRFLQLPQHAQLTATGVNSLGCGPPRRSRRALLNQAVDVWRHVHGHAAPRWQRRCVRQADGQRSVSVCGGRHWAAAPSGARLGVAAATAWAVWADQRGLCDLVRV
jgi:hypothetical protein